MFGVAQPSLTRSAVFLSFSDDGQSIGFDIGFFAMFRAVNIAVALECYILAIDGNDTVKDVFPRGDFSQYGIAHLDVCHSGEDNAIAAIF